MKIDGDNFDPSIVFIAFCLPRKLLVEILNFVSSRLLSQAGTVTVCPPLCGSRN
jgi:hypothetical protein